VTANAWEIVGVIVGLLVGLVSIFLAWRAVQIGRQANEEASKARTAVALERRRTFELEVLRDLLVAVDELFNEAGKIAGKPYLLHWRYSARLAMLPADDLPVWRKLSGLRNYDEVQGAILGGVSKDEVEAWIAETFGQGQSPATRTRLMLTQRLREDVLKAIERRMNARDM
jgi:hypothetical protein